MKFVPELWTLAVLPGKYPISSLKEHFDYDHDWFKKRKKTEPIVLYFRLNSPKQGVVCWLKDNKMIGDEDNLSTFEKVNLETLQSEHTYFDGHYINFKNLDGKSQEEILELLLKVDLEGSKVVFFGMCTNKNECVTKECKKCPVFKDLVPDKLFYGSKDEFSFKV
jgi:hypothetical protein